MCLKNFFKKGNDTPANVEECVAYIENLRKNNISYSAKNKSDKEYAKILKGSEEAKNRIIRELDRLKDVFLEHPKTCDKFVSEINECQTILNSSKPSVPAIFLFPLDDFISKYVSMIDNSVDSNNDLSIDFLIRELKDLIKIRKNSTGQQLFFIPEYVENKNALIESEAKAEYYLQRKKDLQADNEKYNEQGLNLADNEFDKADQLMAYITRNDDEIKSIENTLKSINANIKLSKITISKIEQSQVNADFEKYLGKTLSETKRTIDKLDNEIDKTNEIKAAILDEAKQHDEENQVKNMEIESIQNTSKTGEKASDRFKKMNY